jgi:SnoaL-like protein
MVHHTVSTGTVTDEESAVDKQAFQGWLDRYVEAWKSYDEKQIGDLFSEDAEYRYHPQDEPLRGRDAIVQNWLENKDDPGTYDAHYDATAIDGDVHVATGWSRYFDADGQTRDEYLNVYICRFDDAGRCREFTEYWIQNREMRRRALDEMMRKAVGSE